LPALPAVIFDLHALRLRSHLAHREIIEGYEIAYKEALNVLEGAILPASPPCLPACPPS
jgi:hypothetical protein